MLPEQVFQRRFCQQETIGTVGHAKAAVTQREHFFGQADVGGYPDKKRSAGLEDADQFAKHLPEMHLVFGKMQHSAADDVVEKSVRERQ